MYAPRLFIYAAQAYAQQTRRAQGITHLGHAGRLSDCKRGGVLRGARQACDQVQHCSGDGDWRLAVPGLELAAHGPVVHHAPSSAPAYALRYGAVTRAQHRKREGGGRVHGARLEVYHHTDKGMPNHFKRLHAHERALSLSLRMGGNRECRIFQKSALTACIWGKNASA